MHTGEEIVLSTQTSRWMAFGFLGTKFMIGMLIVIVASGIGQFFEEILFYVFVVVGALYAILFLARLFGMKKEHVVLTNQRVIVKRRLGSSRRQIITPLSHISIFEIQQGSIGRALKFGSITVYTTGNHSIDLESLAKIELLSEGMHAQLTNHWYH